MASSDEIERVESALESAQECDEHNSQDFDEELTSRLETALAELANGERSRAPLFAFH